MAMPWEVLKAPRCGAACWRPVQSVHIHAIHAIRARRVFFSSHSHPASLPGSDLHGHDSTIHVPCEAEG